MGDFHEVFDEWITAHYQTVAPHACPLPYIAPLSRAVTPSPPTTQSHPAAPSLPSTPAGAETMSPNGTTPANLSSPSPASHAPSDNATPEPQNASSSPTAPASSGKPIPASPPAHPSPASSAPPGSEPNAPDAESHIFSDMEESTQEPGEDVEANQSTCSPSADREQGAAYVSSSGTPDAQECRAKAPRKRKAAEAQMNEVYVFYSGAGKILMCCSSRDVRVSRKRTRSAIPAKSVSAEATEGRTTRSKAKAASVKPTTASRRRR